MPEDKQEIYRQAGMDNQVGYGKKPALLVVDLQTGFTDAESSLGGDLSSVIERTNELLDAAHDGNVPVILTRVITTREDGRDFGVWAKKIPKLKTLQTGSKWVEIDPMLHTNSTDHILDKRQASAYHETELDSMLTAMGIDTVVVSGCTTSGCIRATVVDACSHGYHTVVPETAVGDRADEPHDANLFDMDAKYADVRPVEEVTEYLATGTK